MAITKRSDLSLNITAYEKLMRYPLRAELYFDTLADVKPSSLTSKGATISFPIMNDLAAATTPLTEDADVSPVVMGNTAVTVTLAEYGNAVQTSAFLRATAYTEVNAPLANVVGYNGGISIDTICSNVLAAGTNVIYPASDTARNQIATTDNLTGNMVRLAVARLRAGNVMTFGGVYAGHIHPDTSYDFRGGTGGTNWSDPHVYSDPAGIYNGVIGTFQGVRFMEHSRAPLFANASNGAGGAGNIDVYGTLIHGREALAKGYADGVEYGQQPRFVDSPVVDALRRFAGAGWKHLVGYSVFRQAALYRLESASSIGANT